VYLACNRQVPRSIRGAGTNSKPLVKGLFFSLDLGLKPFFGNFTLSLFRILNGFSDGIESGIL
jgi:hypothetical protein